MADDQHIKNPGRVAWGKKLARMSKELKEKKKALTARKDNDEQIEELIQKDIKIDAETKSTLNLHRIEVMVGIGGLALAAVALYLNYKSNKSVQPSPPLPNPPLVLLDPVRSWKDQIEPSNPTQFCYDPRNF